MDGYAWFSVGGGGGRAFSWAGASKGVTPVVAQVLRLLRLRDWNILRTINAMKISPKMTEAATMIPITTLGSPPLLEVLFALAWLASAFPVSVEEVEVTVVYCGWGLGVNTGGGVVTTDATMLGWAVVVGLGVELVLVLVFIIGDESIGIKLIIGSLLVVVVVLLRVVVVVSGSSPPPKRLVKNPNRSSEVVSTLCLATRS
jgi:hypothetical protein